MKIILSCKIYIMQQNFAALYIYWKSKPIFTVTVTVQKKEWSREKLQLSSFILLFSGRSIISFKKKGFISQIMYNSSLQLWYLLFFLFLFLLVSYWPCVIISGEIIFKHWHRGILMKNTVKKCLSNIVFNLRKN